MFNLLNRIVLVGRLVRDPELRYTSNGTPVSNFTLAVERNFKNKQGERDVDYIDIVTWRKLAETCAQHLGKGRMVAVDGRLQIRKSEKENRTYVNPEVVAENVRFLDWPKNSNRTSQNNQEDVDYNGGSEELESDDEFDVPF